MNPIVRVVVLGVQILGRSFVQAWKQAGQNAARDGITPAAAARAARSKAGDITIEEAKKILGLRPPIEKADIETRFNQLFDINDPTKGGSFYLQSKIMCAKVRLEEAIEHKESLD